MTYSLQFGEGFGLWGGVPQLECRSFSNVLNYLRQARDLDRRAAAVDEVVDFFERTFPKRLAHWRQLATEAPKMDARSRMAIPTDRARPPIVAAAGAEMQRRLSEERERARAAIEAATGGQGRSARPDVRASQRSLASRLPD